MLRAVIRGESPKPDTDGVDFEEVYKLAKTHDVLNTSYYAIEKMNITLPPELRKKWEYKRNQCFHRTMIQRSEYAAICSAFEKNGVVYVPIKGFIVSDLYPQPDYRFMSDLDFLVKDSKKAGEAVKAIGYSEQRVNFMYTDEYIKPPFMHIELHRELFRLDSPFYDYFHKTFSRGRVGKTSRLELSNEDSLIYIIAHMHKHYYESGTGIRSVMDIYLINHKLIGILDMNYVTAELEKLGLTEIYRKISDIAEKWFTKGDFEKLSEDELYILTSGTFGTKEHRVINTRSSMKSGEFFFRRIFPSPALIKELFYPAKKHPALLPVFYVYRLIRLIFSPKRRKRIQTELEILKKNKQPKE